MASVPKSQISLSNIQESGMGTRLPVNAVRFIASLTLHYIYILLIHTIDIVLFYKSYT
jgi:hypothetical protein